MRDMPKKKWFNPDSNYREKKEGEIRYNENGCFISWSSLTIGITMMVEICTARLKRRMKERDITKQQLANTIHKSISAINRALRKDTVGLRKLCPIKTTNLSPLVDLLGYSSRKELIQNLIPVHHLHPHSRLQYELVEFASGSSGLRQLPMTLGQMRNDFWKSVTREIGPAGNAKAVEFYDFSPNKTMDFNGTSPLCVIKAIDFWLINELASKGHLTGDDNLQTMLEVPWFMELLSYVIQQSQIRPVVLDLKIDLTAFEGLVVNAGSFGELLNFGSRLGDNFDHWAKDRIAKAKEKTDFPMEEDGIRELAGRHPMSWEEAIKIFSKTPDENERIEEFMRVTGQIANGVLKTLPPRFQQILISLKSDRMKAKTQGKNLESSKYQWLIAAGILWKDGSDIKPVVPHWQDAWHISTGGNRER